MNLGVVRKQSGQRAPRRIDLRLFAVNDGRDVWVLPGGPPVWERDGRT